MRNARVLASKVGVAVEQKRSHGIGGAGNIRMYFTIFILLMCWVLVERVASCSRCGRRSTFGGHLPSEIKCRWNEEERSDLVKHVDSIEFKSRGETLRAFKFVS